MCCNGVYNIMLWQTGMPFKTKQINDVCIVGETTAFIKVTKSELS